MAKGPTQSNALLILSPGYNTLDVHGPYETLRQVRYGDDQKEMFKITIAAEKNITVSAEGMKIERDIPLNQTLVDELGRYDMLIVPGGPIDRVDTTRKSDSLFTKLIKDYSNLPTRSDESVFNDGRFSTTHWAYYTNLAQINAEAADQASTMDIEGKGHKVTPGVVIPARFVDSGINKNQIRIISSGGISCGIDASLHVIRIRAELLAGNGQGEGIAQGIAKRLDYPWRFTEGVVSDNTY